MSVDKEFCCGCGACVNVCPIQCISMIEDAEGFCYPVIDNEKCIECGKCEKICVIKDNIDRRVPQKTLGAVNTLSGARESCSSGGIFELLADAIISEGGYVFGAAFSTDFRQVEMIEIDKKSDIARLKGSKYLQANNGTTMKKVEDALKKGSQVLYSGTPCQVAGLYSYLQKSYDNLFTVEVVCHGVPSQKYWDKYRTDLEEKYESKISFISFRNKDNGWARFGLKLKFENGQEFYEDLSTNMYLQMFLKNFNLRPSCYKCKIKSAADISLGDLWGVDSLAPEFNDDKGTSLVCINTNRGQQLFNKISNNLHFIDVSYEKACIYNPCLIKSVEFPVEREQFYLDLERKPLNIVHKKYEKIIKKQKKGKKKQEYIYYVKHFLVRIRDWIKGAKG